MLLQLQLSLSLFLYISFWTRTLSPFDIPVHLATPPTPPYMATFFSNCWDFFFFLFFPLCNAISTAKGLWWLELSDHLTRLIVPTHHSKEEIATQYGRCCCVVAAITTNNSTYVWGPGVKKFYFRLETSWEHSVKVNKSRNPPTTQIMHAQGDQC